MSAPLPPPPVQKKKGWDCLGCGCALLLVLLLLFVGFMGGGGYLLYSELLSLTSPTATTPQSFDGGDAVYTTADQKVTAFRDSFRQHQPASLHLTADEMNTLIARDETINRLKIHLFITLKDDQAHVQVSCPTNLLPGGFFKDRYLNVDGTVALGFDSDARTVHLIFRGLQVGEKTVPEQNLPLIQSELDPAINTQLQKDAWMKDLIAHTKNLGILHNEFVIETE